MLPREKYLERGIDSLSDTELVAILVGSGVKGKDFFSISRSIVKRIRKVVSNGKDICIEDIDGVEGVGIVTAMRILAGMELGRRVYGLCKSERSLVRDSEDAYGLLRDIGSKKQEYVVGLFLNSRFEVLDKRVVGMGSLDIVSVLPRDIIMPALELNAALVVIAHNHPSGDPSPSEEDILFTKRLSEALDLVGIKLLDHIVIGADTWKSII